MKVKHLDHFNLRAPQEIIEKVKAFYMQVLGFTEGFRPNFGIEGSWLYAGDLPLLHLTVDDGGSFENSGGCIHHIALGCEGLEEFRIMLAQKGISFQVEKIPPLSMTQLFLHDPAGSCIELNFKEE